jgi:hypothetical protein
LTQALSSWLDTNTSFSAAQIKQGHEPWVMKNRIGHLLDIDAVFAFGKLCFKHSHVGFVLLAHPAVLIGRTVAPLNPSPKTQPTT